MPFKCELCHERDAKRQYLTADGRELYVCRECHERELALERDFFDMDSGKFVSGVSSKLSTNKTLMASILGGFIALRRKYRPKHPRTFLFTDRDEECVLKCMFKFLPEEKSFRWTFRLANDNGEDYSYSWLLNIDIETPDLTGTLTMGEGPSRRVIGLEEVNNDIWDLMNMVGKNALDGAKAVSEEKIKEMFNE